MSPGVSMCLKMSQYISINQTLPSRQSGNTMKHHDCHMCYGRHIPSAGPRRPRPSLVDGLRRPFLVKLGVNYCGLQNTFQHFLHMYV